MSGEHPRSLVAVVDAQLAARTVAVGVDRRLRHSEFAGDLLGAHVLVDQPQTIALARRQKFDLGTRNVGSFAHGVKR